VDGGHRVEARAPPATNEQRLVIEVLEVAIDGAEVIDARQCSEGGAVGSPVPPCAPVPVEPEGVPAPGAVVPPCGGVPVAGGAAVPGSVVVPGDWVTGSCWSGAVTPPVRVGAVV
jgi:hypothetical protein